MDYFQSVQNIFQDQLFSIPDYQRGYAWDERQWQDLWDDIELLDEGQEHYTGTLVIVESGKKLSDDNGVEFKYYDIVDGQQRLTTISIFMIEMIRQFEKLGDKKAVELRKRYIVTNKDGVPVPKISLNRDTNDFYQKRIISVESDITKRPRIMSEKRLSEAQKFFKKCFEGKKKELGNSDFTKWLDETRAKVVSQIKFTVYLVPKASDVGVIFEVMNNRGKQLTEMEKTKNYFLFVCAKLSDLGGEDLAEKVNSAWKYIYEMLMENGESDSEDKLLRFNWIATQNPRPIEWSGCNSIKETFSLKDFRGNYAELRDSVRVYIDLLRNSCKAYCDIIAPDCDKAFDWFTDRKIKKDILEYSHKLVRLGTTASFIPLLISLRLKNIDEARYLEVLKLCELYAFRVFAFMEKRTTAGQSGLYQAAYYNFTDEWVFEDVCAEIRRNLTRFCPNEDFESEVDFVGNWYEWKGIKYLLFEYEMHLAAGANVHVEWKTFQKKDKKDTIEHILPQTPDKQYWLDHWTKKQIKKATHDLGNLVVTLDNSSYGNKGFDEKKGNTGKGKCYANSNLFSERELCNYADWTYSAFLERREKIAEWMKKRWYIEDYEDWSAGAIEEDDDLGD
jgi:hypothetical protein